MLTNTLAVPHSSESLAPRALPPLGLIASVVRAVRAVACARLSGALVPHTEAGLRLKVLLYLQQKEEMVRQDIEHTCAIEAVALSIEGLETEGRVLIAEDRTSEVMGLMYSGSEVAMQRFPSSISPPLLGLHFWSLFGS